jgi:hypothetical protein
MYVSVKGWVVDFDGLGKHLQYTVMHSICKISDNNEFDHSKVRHLDNLATLYVSTLLQVTRTVQAYPCLCLYMTGQRKK